MEQKNDQCRLPPRPRGDAPWLVYTYGKTMYKKTQTFCNISDLTNATNNNKYTDAVYTKSIPELRGKIICASYYGWLVLHDLDNAKEFSLWNALTSQSLNLPPLPHLPLDDDNEELMLSNCALTSPPTTATDCVLVLSFGDHVFWCRPNHNTSINWITQRLDLNGKRLEIDHSTTLDGIIYSWANVRSTSYSTKRKLVSLKVDDADLNLLTLKSLEIEIPDWKYPYVHFTHYLVESCGLIYCVGVLIRHRSDDKISIIKVWELDLLDRKWVEVKCLDGRAFFLEYDSCTWCWGSDSNDPIESSPSNVGVQGNCVYYICNDDILCSYNLAEGCVTQFRTCTNLQTPISVNWLSVVMPQQNREHSNKTNNNPHIDDDDDDDDDSQGRESLLISKLPKEVIQLISEYLNLFDYENFRASCKTLQSIVLPLSQKRANKLLSSPMFIFFKDDYGLCQVVDLSRDSYCSLNHLQLDSNPFTVEFSKDGWLVVYNPYWEAIRYVNLFTGEWENLPFDDELLISDVKGIGFSTNPNSPDCVTVLFTNIGHVIYYIRYGDETWSKFEFANEEEKFWIGRSSPVYLAGAFYVLGSDGRLGEFKVAAEGENHSWEVYGSPDTRDHCFHSYHLVECRGDLWGVFIGYMGMWVEAFKFDLSELKWIKPDKGLGSYSLFVSNPSSFSSQPSEARMRNRIYVPRLKGNSIMFYSLDTGKFHVSGSEDGSYEDFCGTTEPLHCFWFQENYAN